MHQRIRILLAWALLLGAAASAYAKGRLDPRLKHVRSASRAERRAMSHRMGGPGLDKDSPTVRVFIRLKPGVNKAQLKSLFPSGQFRSQNGDVVTAELPLDLLDQIDDSPYVESVEASRKAEPEMDVVLSNTVFQYAYIGTLPGGKRELNGVQGAGVTIGFVDTGIDWKHKDFIIDESSQTRVYKIWDQTSPSGGGCSSPAGFGYGCEWTRAQINNELDGTPPNVVKSSDTNGHGTHVAGIACGDGTATDGDQPVGTYTGVAQAADIVMVKTDYYEDSIVDGINYIIQQAQVLNARAVVNLSLGGQTGPHDGTDSYESAINAIAASTPVVKSAGNDRMNNVHAAVVFTPAVVSTTVVLTVNSPQRAIETEFWHMSSASFTVAVGFNGCGSAVNATVGNENSGTICGSHYIYIANSTYTATNGAHQTYIYISHPTNIAYTNVNVAFTPTPGPISNFMDGFVSPALAWFSSHYDGVMAISEPGNAPNVITVGAYCSKNTWSKDGGGTHFDDYCSYTDQGQISAYSSLGPTRIGVHKPDLSAPAQQVAAALSSAITPDPNHVAVDGRHRLASGTSQAAPVVAGAIALKLGLNKNLTAAQVRSQLESEALVDDRVDQGGVPNSFFGHGKVHVTPPLTGSPSMDPSMLTVSSVSIRWAWTASATNHTENKVHRAGNAALLATAGYATTDWLENGLTPNTSYTAFIVISNSLQSSTGTAVSTRTLAAAPVSAAPSGVSPTAVTANWGANGNPGSTEYYAQVATDQGFTSIFNSSPWTTDAFWPFVGLSINTTYYFRVKARNAVLKETGYTVLPATPTSANIPGSMAPLGPWVSSITVRWDPNSNPGGTEFATERAQDAAHTIDLVPSPWSAATSWSFIGLTPNTTYYFGARARNIARVPTSPVELPWAVTQATAPETSPVIDLYESSFTATWLGGPNPSWTEYLAERATDASFTQDLGDSGWVRAAAYTFTGLIPNTTYYLRARARNTQGVETDPAALPLTVTRAAAPTSLPPTSVSSASLVAHWGTGANPGITRYRFDRAYDPAFSSGTATVTVAAGSLPMAGLVPSTSFYMRVRAVNHAGVATDWTTLPTTATLAQQPGSRPPTSVLDLRLTANWDPGSNPAPTQYLAERARDAAFSLDVASSGWVSGDSHIFRELAMNTTYYTRVKARNVAGTQTPFTTLPSTLTLNVVATLPPENIVFSSVGPTHITAGWTLMSPGESPLFVLATSEDFAILVASQTGYVGQEGASFYSLSPNTSHYFKIKVSTAGDMFYSDVKTVLTQAQIPSTAPPSSLATDSFQMNWLANGNPVDTLFLAERALDSSFTAGLTSSPWVTATSYAFSGLSVNTSYYVRVRGRSRAGGETVASATGTVSSLANLPGSLSPADISANSVRARWTANGNPPGTTFLCERREGYDESGWITGTDYPFSGLTPNTTYYFNVRGRNRDGVVTTQVQLPNALTLSALPATQAASEVSSVSFRANWGTNGNPAGTEYTIERSTAFDYSGDLAASGWITATAWTFDTLSVNARYFSRIKSRNAARLETGAVDMPSVTTLASPPVPGGTSGVYSSSVTVNWGAGVNPSGTAYYAEASTDPAFGGGVSASTLDTILTYTFRSLNPGTTYYFRVRARNQDGASTAPVDLPSAMTVAAAPGPGTPPGTGLDWILRTWDPSGNPPGTLYYAEKAAEPTFAAPEDSGWITSSSHTFTGLSVNTTYYFRVKAKNPGGVEGPWGDLPAIATLASPPTSQPTTGVGINTLAMNWTRGASPVTTQYLAELATDQDFTLNLAGSGWVTGVSAPFGGLAPNTRYYLRVRGRSHNGALTSVVDLGQTVTLASPPVTADPSYIFDVSVVANWGANGNPGGTLYLAQRALDAGFSLDLQSSAWGQETSYAFTGLTKSTRYYFQVKAKNSDGSETGFTALPSAVTLSAVPVPTNVRFSAASQTGLTAQWNLLSPPDNQPVYGLSDRRDFAVTIASALGSVAQQSAAFSSLTPNTSYFFKVRLSTASDDYYSVPVVSATLPRTPGTPAQAGLGANSLSVSWASNGNGAGTYYLAQADTDPAFASVDSSSHTVNAQGTVSGLSPNTRYYVRVRTQHHGGSHTAFAPAIPLTTLSPAPSPAVTGILGVTFSSVTAQWIALPLGSCAGYVLQASTASDFSGTLYSQSQSGDLSRLSVGGIPPGATVYLRAGSLNSESNPNFLTLGSTVTLSADAQRSTATWQFDLRPQEPELVSIQVTIPAAALPAGTPVSVHTGVRFAMPPPATNMGRLTLVGNGVGVDIDAGGLQPSRPVVIVMTYDPAQLPANVDPNALVVARYDEGSSRWILLPTRVDARTRTITTETTHFSLFGLFVSAAGSALDAVQVFPIPWEPGSGSAYDSGVITFSNMPAGTSVEIFSLLGESIWKGEAPASGIATWGGANPHGIRTGSGTYLAVIRGGGERKVVRVVVVR